MDDDMFDDSVDDALASIDIPPANKVPKISSAAPSAASTSASATEIVKTVSLANSRCIQVNPKQRGNPLLKSISNCPYEFCDIVPDYVVGKNACVLYLSLRYHILNSEYIYQRLKELGKQYSLRVLLVQIDTPEPHNALKSLTRVSLLADLTLMLAWNADEAAKIIETYKLFENRPPDLIMERAESNPHQKLVTALTNIKPVNKTDAVSLLQNFGTLENIVNASEDRLSLVTGLGPRKAKKLHKTLHESFMTK